MALRVSWRRRDGDEAERVEIGRDGLAMLALSLGLIVASLGLAWLLAMRRVAREAARSSTPPLDGTPIIVLGVQLSRDGSPGREYRERLDRGAVQLMRAPDAAIVVLGGTTRPGFPSEAERGRNYLVDRWNVPPARVRCEPRSRHTLENLRFHRAARGEDIGPIALVTSRYHMARACLLARGLGLTVCAIPSDDGPRAALRVLVRMPWEGLLIHWYGVGRAYARLTRNDRMTARIS